MVRIKESEDQTVAELYGPLHDAALWDVLIHNIQTGARTTTAHHCKECKGARSRRCFDKFEYCYCAAWVLAEDGTWRRCGEVFALMSKGCGTHPFTTGANEGFRKAARKGYLEKKYFPDPPVAETAPEITTRMTAEDKARIVEEENARINEKVDSGQEVNFEKEKAPYEKFNEERLKLKWKDEEKKKKEQEAARQKAAEESALKMKAAKAKSTMRVEHGKNMKCVLNKYKKSKVDDVKKASEEKEAKRQAASQTEQGTAVKRGMAWMPGPRR